MKPVLATAAAALLAAAGPAGLTAADSLAHWASYARTARAGKLVGWMRCVMREEMTGRKCEAGKPEGAPPFFGRHGIFVTLVRGRTVRGCYGAFHHKSDDLALVLREYLMGALRCDPRHEPLDESEYEETDIVITVAGDRFPVDDPDLIDISREGLALSLEDGGRLVFVPAEFRSIDYMKTKIPRNGVVQAFGFRAVTIR
ncbi:MAG TPA: AMMECR1 domain-containing protein [Spirochaetes bacterium]|nr:AMMECR1 domain-containing protein [Spirochaetota bacterium]